jgi:TolA-binding protein
MERSSLNIIIGVVGTLGLIAGTLWFLWRTLKRSDDRPSLVLKWLLTALVLGFLLRGVMPVIAEGGYAAAFFGVPATAACGLVLAIIWGQNIAMIVAKPLASLYDGGDVADDPKPFYSRALAKRKRGDYLGARADVLAELARFPADFEGQMLLAEMEAQDLHDLRAAEVTVLRLVGQKGHAPTNIAYALFSMADWHLKFAQDPDAARVCLEQVIELLPDSEWALRAAQRIAHLGSRELLLGAEGRRTFRVQHIEGDPGLGSAWGKVQPAPEEDPAATAAKFVKHLEEYPLDTEIREQLARLYAEHYHRLDLAESQLEQMIQHPQQPAKQVVRWLNLLADLQIKHGGSQAAARATLQRIVDLYPDAAAAQIARNRIEHLPLEFRGQEKTQTVALGTYEDDLGLKGRSPQ